MYARFLSSFVLGVVSATAPSAWAKSGVGNPDAAGIAQQPTLAVEVSGIGADGRIDPAYALCKPTADGKSAPGMNTKPTVRWSGVPQGTRSFAVLVTDPDVPADFSDAGKADRTLAVDAPRRIFYHWASVDIPASVNVLNIKDADARSELGRELTNDLGLNQYVKPPSAYGGPCPPFNDTRMHHYHFTVYALSVETLKLPENATAKDAATALAPHVIASGEAVGTYTLHPPLLTP